MLSKREITELMTVLTYKPGVTFTVRFSDGPLDAVHLTITRAAPDASDPQARTIPLSFTIWMERAALDNGAQFLGWLWEQVLTMEAHEAEEWFRVQGRRFRKPHPP